MRLRLPVWFHAFIQAIPSDFTRRCLSALERDGGATSKAAGHDDAPAPTLLLSEWAKATLPRCSWKDALVAAANVTTLFCFWPPSFDSHSDGLQFTLPRATIYRAVCERLETIDRITDAVECFHHITSGLGGKIILHGEHSGWARREWSLT